MFNNNKLKKIESDILDLQYDVKNLKETINQAEKNIEESKVFKKESHFTYGFECGSYVNGMDYLHRTNEEVVDNKVYIKEVLEAILKKMNVKLIYIPGKEGEYSLETMEKPKKKSKK